MRRQIVLVLTVLLCGAAASAQTIFSGSGPDAAAIAGVRDAFRTDLGGGTIAGANGSFGGVRREINWDGVPAQFAAPNNLPADFFNVNSPRGVIFATPGSGFQVSGATTDAGPGQPAPLNFGNIDPSYTTTFETFSPQRLFTPLGSTVTDVQFFIAGTTTPGFTRGFGAVFSDVDNADTTSIEYFDSTNTSLGTFFAPTANAGLSFLGVTFPTAVISRVRITTGNFALSAGAIDNPPEIDVVVMDDFIYGEPAASGSVCSVTCPLNVVASNDLGACGAAVTYPAPVTTGTCGTVTSTPPSGSTFPVGTTVVTVTTAAGPSCTFTVAVNDTQAPVIACPANISTTATGPSGAVVNYTTPTATDNCPAVPAPVCAPASGSTFIIGSTTVTCSSTDAAGNTGSCSFVVNVAPVAAVPTMSEWLLMALGAMLGIIGVLRVRLS